jgi:hypothetical protein
MAYPERLTGRCFPTTHPDAVKLLPTTERINWGGCRPTRRRNGYCLTTRQDLLVQRKQNPSMVDFLKEHEELINWVALTAPTQ